MEDKTTDKIKQKTIVFLHPDLGIGGAERLVIDAAVGLQNRGYRIVIFTSHCDKGHCFEEARDGNAPSKPTIGIPKLTSFTSGTLDVRVRGDAFPSSILSRLMIICAIARQLLLLFQVWRTGELAELKPDYFFVDQLSAGLPVLQYLRPRAPILFYCHFPDLLLVQGRQSFWKRVYRCLPDLIERWSMSFADAIAVNSKFTRGVVGRTWPSLVRGRELKVVYPCIDTRPKEEASDIVWSEGDIILSINRFERKKDVALAIKAFAGLSKTQRKGIKLVIAGRLQRSPYLLLFPFFWLTQLPGGHDTRVPENVGYHNELIALADSLKLKNATVRSIVTTLNVSPETEVIFLLSVTNSLKQLLLQKAKLLVYTPSNEHFGIVPIEAMLAGVPVLAANTGGPTETILEGETGWLRDPEQVGEWTKVMDQVLNKMSKDELAEMSRVGVARVRDNFADTQMAQRLDGIYAGIGTPVRGSWGIWFSCVIAFLATAVAVSGGAAIAILWALYLTKHGEAGRAS